MKLTKSRLKQLIKEQLETVLQEQEALQPGYAIEVIKIEKANKRGVTAIVLAKKKGDPRSADTKIQVDSKNYNKKKLIGGVETEVRISINKQKTPGADKDPKFANAQWEGEFAIEVNGKEKVEPWSPGAEKYVNSYIRQLLAAPEFKQLDRETKALNEQDPLRGAKPAPVPQQPVARGAAPMPQQRPVKGAAPMPGASPKAAKKQAPEAAARRPAKGAAMSAQALGAAGLGFVKSYMDSKPRSERRDLAFRFMDTQIILNKMKKGQLTAEQALKAAKNSLVKVILRSVKNATPEDRKRYLDIGKRITIS